MYNIVQETITERMKTHEALKKPIHSILKAASDGTYFPVSSFSTLHPLLSTDNGDRDKERRTKDRESADNLTMDAGTRETEVIRRKEEPTFSINKLFK